MATSDPTAVWRGWTIRETSGGGGRPNVIHYHPDDRFWQFQIIETTILLALSAVLLATAWRLVQGRARRASVRHAGADAGSRGPLADGALSGGS